uniref:Translocon-associated protein subunit alpha n=1 Tax=Ditylenchus dipsaci TaxID=166011 RepID=A0A915DYR0_9BILA
MDLLCLGFALRQLYLSLRSLRVAASEDPLEAKYDGQELGENAEDQSMECEEDSSIKEEESPEMGTREMFAGQSVRGLVNLWNRGEQSFVVKAIEASFCSVDNFTECLHTFDAASLDRTIESGDRGDLDFSFTPSENMIGGGRLQLAVKVLYEDEDGTSFVSTLFNESMMVVRDDLAFLNGIRLPSFLAAVAGVVICGLRVSISSRVRNMPTWKTARISSRLLPLRTILKTGKRANCKKKSGAELATGAVEKPSAFRGQTREKNYWKGSMDKVVFTSSILALAIYNLCRFSTADEESRIMPQHWSTQEVFPTLYEEEVSL